MTDIILSIKNYLHQNLKLSKNLVFCPKDIFLKRRLAVSSIYTCKPVTAILLRANTSRLKKQMKYQIKFL